MKLRNCILGVGMISIVWGCSNSENGKKDAISNQDQPVQTASQEEFNPELKAQLPDALPRYVIVKVKEGDESAVPETRVVSGDLASIQANADLESLYNSDKAQEANVAQTDADDLDKISSDDQNYRRWSGYRPGRSLVHWLFHGGQSWNNWRQGCWYSCYRPRNPCYWKNYYNPGYYNQQYFDQGQGYAPYMHPGVMYNGSNYYYNYQSQYNAGGYNYTGYSL